MDLWTASGAVALLLETQPMTNYPSTTRTQACHEIMLNVHMFSSLQQKGGGEVNQSRRLIETNF